MPHLARLAVFRVLSYGGVAAGLPAPPNFNLARRTRFVPRQKATATWLFDIASDPSETCNLAESMPAKVTSLLARLKVYNATAVPVISPAADPASDPAKQRGP